VCDEKKHIMILFNMIISPIHIVILYNVINLFSKSYYDII